MEKPTLLQIKDSEIVRLNHVCDGLRESMALAKINRVNLEARYAALQAENAELREALEQVETCLDDFDQYEADARHIIQKALAVAEGGE